MCVSRMTKVLTFSQGRLCQVYSNKNVSVKIDSNRFRVHPTALNDLLCGNTWTATVGGKTYNSTTSIISVELTAGNYNISVSSTSGYAATMPSHNITMGTANQSFLVAFSSRSPGSLASAAVYGSIGKAAVLGGAVGVFGTMFYTGTGFFRKKKL